MHDKTLVRMVIVVTVPVDKFTDDEWEDLDMNSPVESFVDGVNDHLTMGVNAVVDNLKDNFPDLLIDVSWS